MALVQLDIRHRERMVEIGKRAFCDGVTRELIRKVGSNGGQFRLNQSLLVALDKHGKTLISFYWPLELRESFQPQSDSTL